MPVDKDGWIVLDRTTINQIAKDKQRIAELEKLATVLFVTLQSAHAAAIALSDNDALNAELELRNATLEAEVTRILGRQTSPTMISDDSQLIHALSEQNLRLTSEVEALRKDRDRIEWLQLQEHRQMVENENISDFLVWYPWIKTAWGKTYREALDNAMAMEPEPIQHKAGV